MTDTPPPPPAPEPGASQQMQAQPTAPPPRGLPAWGWVLIAVGAFLVLAFMAVVVIAVVTITAFRDAPGEPIGAPAPTPAPTSEATEAPVVPGGGPFSLDSIAPASQGPFWGVPGEMLTEWETVVFDVDGLNHFQNVELGCDFRTYQSFGVGDQADVSDRAASEAQMDVLAEVWLSEGLTDVDRVQQDSVWLEMDSTDEVEFLVDRIDGTYAETGVESQTYLIGREFLASQGALAARLECRTDVMEGQDSPLPWILDELGVSTF
jgi:hypothetical protein